MGGASEVVPGVAVELRTKIDGPTVAREVVRLGDLAEPMAELAFVAGVRRNGNPLALSDLIARIRPVERTSRNLGRICTGFTLETIRSAGAPSVRGFDRNVLEPAATRAGKRLLAEGALEKGDLYFYTISVEDSRVGPIVIEGEAPCAPPSVRLLRPLLAGAKHIAADRERGLEDELYALQHARADVRPRAKLPAGDAGGVVEDARDEDRGPDDADSVHYPVLYVRGAYEKASRIARKGAAMTPPVETGGLLLGALHWAPDTRQLFALIEDVLEASQTEGTTYSLEFTGETWTRVQAVLKARRKNPATRHQIVLGQIHGHNFLPFNHGGASCDDCPSQGHCGISTAYLSASDRTWCGAVFPRMPHQLSHVFGLTPRREPVSAFYGQRGAELERRGYCVLDEGPPPESG